MSYYIPQTKKHLVHNLNDFQYNFHVKKYTLQEHGWLTKHDTEHLKNKVLSQLRVFMVFPFVNADTQSLSDSHVSKERSNSPLH